MKLQGTLKEMHFFVTSTIVNNYKNSSDNPGFVLKNFHIVDEGKIIIKVRTCVRYTIFFEGDISFFDSQFLKNVCKK